MENETLIYSVPGVSCAHCVDAVTVEVRSVPGVSRVEVDLETKLVTVTGADLEDGALRAAIEDAGYEVAA